MDFLSGKDYDREGDRFKWEFLWKIILILQGRRRLTRGLAGRRSLKNWNLHRYESSPRKKYDSLGATIMYRHRIRHERRTSKGLPV